jgi:excisionase family DNA binding protein
MEFALAEHSVYRSFIHNRYGSLEKIRTRLRVLVRYRHPINGTDTFEEYIAHAGFSDDLPADEHRPKRALVIAACGPPVRAWAGQSFRWELRGKLKHPDDVSCVSCRELLGYPIDRLKSSFRSTGAIRPTATAARGVEIARDTGFQLRAKRRADPANEADFRLQVITSLREIIDLLSEQGTHRAKEFLTAQEAATYLGVHVKSVYDFCRYDGLRHARPTEKDNGQIRIKREWIDEWMARREVVQKF